MTDIALHHKSSRPWSFAMRLTTAMSALVFAAGLAIFILSQRSARIEAERMANEHFGELSKHAIAQARQYVDRSTPLLITLQNMAQQGLVPLDDDDRLTKALLTLLRANEGLSWISYADTAGRFIGVTRAPGGTLGINQSHIDTSDKTRLVEAQVDDADLTWKNPHVTEDSGYDPRKRPFYQSAERAGGSVVWLDPYIFYGQNVPGITTAAALVRDGRVVGVFTVDFTLASLANHLGTLRASPNSEVTLFTSNGELIANGQRSDAPPTTSPSAALPKLREAKPLLTAFAKAMDAETSSAAGNSKLAFSFAHDSERYLARATPFSAAEGQNWVIGITAPERDFLAGAWRTQSHVALVCLLALALAIALCVVLSRMVSRPVLALRERMRRIGAGDFESQVDLGSSSEFQELSRSLDSMVNELQEGLRLRHSIGVAMEVQRKLLPQSPPSVAGLDIAGYSKYCDETGGDYYDFLATDAIGPNRLMIVVGDVMGHGVGSALVMAGARAVLRDRVADDGALATLLDRLNSLVGADTRGSQFMTMAIGVVDAVERTYRFASAGHDPAIIYRVENGGRFDEVDEAGLPLGVTDDGMYAEFTVKDFQPGDLVLIGTDGIWEARSADGEEFGKDRIREVMASNANRPAADLAAELVARLHAFRGDAPVRDDITFVLIKFC